MGKRFNPKTFILVFMIVILSYVIINDRIMTASTKEWDFNFMINNRLSGRFSDINDSITSFATPIIKTANTSNAKIIVDKHTTIVHKPKIIVPKPTTLAYKPTTNVRTTIASKPKTTMPKPKHIVSKLTTIAYKRKIIVPKPTSKIIVPKPTSILPKPTTIVYKHTTPIKLTESMNRPATTSNITTPNTPINYVYIIPIGKLRTLVPVNLRKNKCKVCDCDIY